MPEHVDRVMRMAMARHRRRGATPDGRLYEGHAFLYDLVKRLSSTTPAS